MALTANVLDDHRSECLAVGRNDFLARPLIKERLAQTLCRHLPARTTG